MTTEEFYTYQEQLFDAFSKRVIKNLGIDIFHEMDFRREKEVSLSLYYRVVVIKAPLQGLCYTVRDAVDWCFSPTTRMVSERFQPQPLTLLLIS